MFHLNPCQSSEGLHLGGLGALLLVNFKYIIFMVRGPDGPPKKREPQRTGKGRNEAKAEMKTWGKKLEPWNMHFSNTDS